VTYRYSCNSGTSGAELFLIDDKVKSLHTVTFPATGGWQNWNSVTVSDSLPAGLKTIRFTALTGGFNLNRIEFVQIPGSADTTAYTKAGFRLYPNPAENFIIVEISNPNGNVQQLKLVDMLGRILYEQDTPSTVTAKCTVDTSPYLPGMYMIRVEDNQTIETQPFLIRKI
jgi:hypothetical protein